MTAYMAWADDIVLTNASQLPDAEIMAPRNSLFGSIAGTFDHIVVVGEIFRAHLEGRPNPHSARHRSSVLPFREIANRLRGLDQHFAGLARHESAAALAEVIDFEFVDGGEGSMTRAEILLHLVNHSTYHRGFISTLLYQTGKRGAPNDLTVFLRDVWPRQMSGVSSPPGR